MKNVDTLDESDKDTLARIALAAAAGLVTAAGGKKYIKCIKRNNC